MLLSSLKKRMAPMLPAKVTKGTSQRGFALWAVVIVKVAAGATGATSARQAAGHQAWKTGADDQERPGEAALHFLDLGCDFFLAVWALCFGRVFAKSSRQVY